jgi:hypothetical protein
MPHTSSLRATRVLLDAGRRTQFASPSHHSKGLSDQAMCRTCVKDSEAVHLRTSRFVQAAAAAANLASITLFIYCSCIVAGPILHRQP